LKDEQKEPWMVAYFLVAEKQHYPSVALASVQGSVEKKIKAEIKISYLDLFVFILRPISAPLPSVRFNDRKFSLRIVLQRLFNS